MTIAESCAVVAAAAVIAIAPYCARADKYADNGNRAGWYHVNQGFHNGWYYHNGHRVYHQWEHRSGRYRALHRYHVTRQYSR